LPSVLFYPLSTLKLNGGRISKVSSGNDLIGKVSGMVEDTSVF